MSFSKKGPVSPSLPATASSVAVRCASKIRRVVHISGRGCALEIFAEASREKLFAVSRQNGESAFTEITFWFSEEIEEHPLLVDAVASVSF